MSTIRILIADDHAIVREGISALVARRAEMEVIGEARDGGEAVMMSLQLRQDVILIDLRMPKIGGVEAIEQIRRQWPEARIIVLTTYDSDQDIFRALRAGARAYLLKDTPREELLDAIRVVHAGQKRIPPDVAAKLIARISLPDLTERELDVLRLLVAGKSNKEIAIELLIGEGTVKTHVVNILGKLQAENRTEAAHKAREMGLC